MIAAVSRGGPWLRRYGRALTYAGRDQLAYPAALLTRGVLLVIFVFVFNTLWRAITGDDGQLRGLTVVQLTWYLVFIVGGMFFPLDLLPPWLSGLAARLPFAFQAYWPARMLVDPAPELFREALLGTALYAVVLGGLAVGLFQLGMRRVQANGG